MATRSLGQLTIDVIAKVGGFVEGMRQAESSSAKWRKQVERNISSAATKFKWGAGIAAGAMVYWTKTSLDAAAETENLARLANTSTTDFQRYAAGSKTVGIENEKLADILKDVTERVGEFLQTGSGPMKDFFENIAPLVGVTADSFKDLSGADALGLYVSSLEKAGLSQQDMTFYMESMASDASALIPLLKDDAKQMKALGDEAESLGTILSDDTIKASKQFRDDMDQLGQVASSVGAQVGAELLPELADLADSLKNPETIKAAADLAKGVVGGFSKIIHWAKETVKFTQWAGESIAAALNGPAIGDTTRIEEAIKKQENLIERQKSRSNLGGPNSGSVVDIAAEEKKLAALREKLKLSKELREVIPIPVLEEFKPEKSESKTGGGGTKLTAGQLKAREEAEKLRLELDKQVVALQLQASVLGLSSAETELFKLAAKGATEEQLGLARAALEASEAFDAQNESRQEFVSIAESLKTEEEQIRESHQRRWEIILENTENGSERQRELLGRLTEETNQQLTDINQGFWQSYLDAAEESLTSLDDLALSTIENFSSSFGGALESVVFDFQNVGDAFDQLMEGMGRATVNALGKMAAEWVAYQLVQMVVGKSGQAGALAAVTGQATSGVMLAGINAFSSTAAIPIVGPGLAPAAMTAAIAATSPMASAAVASAASGFAGGFDKGGHIPAGMFGLVGEQGPELINGPINVTGRENTAATFRRIAQDKAANDSVNQTVIVQINGVETQADSVDKEGEVTRVLINQASAKTSKFSRAMQDNWDLKPRSKF